MFAFNLQHCAMEANGFNVLLVVNDRQNRLEVDMRFEQDNVFCLKGHVHADVNIFQCCSFGSQMCVLLS